MTETPRLTEAQIAEIERAASTRVASGRRIGADPDLLAAFRQLRADLSDSRSYAELQAKSGQNLLRRIRECAIAVGDVTPETAHTLTGDYAPALVGIVQFIADDREKLQTDLAALRASKAAAEANEDAITERAEALKEELAELRASKAQAERERDEWKRLANQSSEKHRRIAELAVTRLDEKEDAEARLTEAEQSRETFRQAAELNRQAWESAESRLTTAREALREYFDAKRDYEANVAAHEGWIERNIRLTTAERVLTALAAAAGEGETP